MSNVPVDAVSITRALRENIVPHPRSEGVSIADILLFAGIEVPTSVTKVMAYEDEDHFVIVIHYQGRTPQVLELSFNENLNILYWSYWSRRGVDMISGDSGSAKVAVLRHTGVSPVTLSTNLNSRSTIHDRMVLKVALPTNINRSAQAD